jgi:hypothetical protein
MHRHPQHWVYKTQDEEKQSTDTANTELDCLSSSCVLNTQCWQCLWIVFLHPVSCIPSVVGVYALFIYNP